MDENEISRRVIGAAVEVHKYLGPGLLESVYKQCMVRELRLQAIGVDTELVLKGQYKGLNFDIDYRMDMLVAGKVVVELKVVDVLLPVHKAQLLSYMKLSGIKLGLLINFNEAVVKNGVKRIVNKL
jgi:GxxExxY protein